MWSIKFLKGPLAGQSLPLQVGRNVVGRAPNCDVVIPSGNVSKEHVRIDIEGNNVTVTDLGSRNGTFVNGVQVQTHRVRPGERVGLFDILFEIEKRSASRPRSSTQTSARALPGGPSSHGNLAYDQNYDPALNAQDNPYAQAVAQKNQPGQGLWAYLVRYIDEVVLPGVYKLPEWMEFKITLGVFVGLFIVLVTALSTVPLMRILKSSIEKEAQNRAQTIARSLARDNKSAIMQGNNSLVSTANADREAGAEAYVISREGEILAPAQLSGQYLTKIDFVNEARKSDDEQVRQISDSTIVAVAPIRYYDSRAGTEVTSAQAVVVYNMGALAVDDGRTVSLFVQILFIAILLGGLLFFFFYKTITHPLHAMNAQLNDILKSGQGQVTTTYLFPELQKLASNITSAVSRGAGGFASDSLQNFEADRSFEMRNLVNLVGFAAMTITPTDRMVTAVNSHFTSYIGGGTDWENLSIDRILDQALKLNIQGLVDRVVADPTQAVTDQLEIANSNYEISAQGVHGAKALAYILIVFTPKGGDV